MLFSVVSTDTFYISSWINSKYTTKDNAGKWKTKSQKEETIGIL